MKENLYIMQKGQVQVYAGTFWSNDNEGAVGASGRK